VLLRVKAPVENRGISHVGGMKCSIRDVGIDPLPAPAGFFLTAADKKSSNRGHRHRGGSDERTAENVAQHEEN